MVGVYHWRRLIDFENAEAFSMGEIGVRICVLGRVQEFWGGSSESAGCL